MADATDLRAYSEQMFRSMYWMEVSCAIAEEGGAVWLRGVAEACGLPDARVHKPFRQLIDLGLLEPLPVVPGQQAKYYDPVKSVYWTFVLALRDEVLSTGSEPERTGGPVGGG